MQVQSQRAFLLIAVTFWVAGCGGGGSTPQESIGIRNQLISISINPSTVTMVPNQSGVLQVTAQFSAANPRDVTGSATFQSSDTNIVTVAGGGVINALALGNATITATYDSGTEGTKSATVPVTVASVAPDHIDITPITISLGAGQLGQFSARLVSSDGTSTDVTQTATWTSSNTEIFTVIGPGQIRTTNQGFAALLGGSATLRARQGIAEGQAFVRLTGRVP
jgi:hypothetical protein